MKKKEIINNCRGEMMTFLETQDEEFDMIMSVSFLKTELEKQREEIKTHLLANGHGGGNWRRLINQL